MTDQQVVRAITVTGVYHSTAFILFEHPNKKLIGCRLSGFKRLQLRLDRFIHEIHLPWLRSLTLDRQRVTPCQAPGTEIVPGKPDGFDKCLK